VTVYAEGSGARVATVFETEANARLIAAAPDLLEAAKYAVSWLGSGETDADGNLSDTSIYKTLQRAIAKAEGNE
jgi:citrate lyase beta subunit